MAYKYPIGEREEEVFPNTRRFLRVGGKYKNFILSRARNNKIIVRIMTILRHETKNMDKENKRSM